MNDEFYSLGTLLLYTLYTAKDGPTFNGCFQAILNIQDEENQ